MHDSKSTIRRTCPRQSCSLSAPGGEGRGEVAPVRQSAIRNPMLPPELLVINSTAKEIMDVLNHKVLR